MDLFPKHYQPLHVCHIYLNWGGSRGQCSVICQSHGWSGLVNVCVCVTHRVFTSLPVRTTAVVSQAKDIGSPLGWEPRILAPCHDQQIESGHQIPQRRACPQKNKETRKIDASELLPFTHSILCPPAQSSPGKWMVAEEI